MKLPPDDPVRWRDQGADRQALEERAATLVTAAADVAPLSPAALARIRSDVLRAGRPMSAGDGRGGGLLPDGRRIRFATLAVLVLLLSAATAGGASRLWRRYVAPRTTPVTPIRAPLPATPVLRPAGASSRASIDEPAAPAAAPGAAATDVSSTGAVRPTPRRVIADTDAPRAPVSPPPPPAPAARATDPPASPASESHLLAVALAELRQRRDPRAALAALDEYERAYPHGVLRPEATSARIEAVLLLRDWKTALALLDATPELTEPLGADLLLVRAELRAQAERCREALLDFSELLDGQVGWSRAPANAASERALYGRAVCFGRLRQDDRARADLEAYQGRFPRGRFAPDVERLLAPGSGTNPRREP